MIEWDESMSTGVPYIDAQHKTLIQKFNEFSEVLTNNEVKVAAGEMLDFLRFYAVWHFEREEQAMEKHQCPAAEKNKQEHEKFIKLFNQFYLQWQDDDTNIKLAEKTYQKLEHWIENHIRFVDTELHSYVET